jgi:hypothetical protein
MFINSHRLPRKYRYEYQFQEPQKAQDMYRTDIVDIL